MKRLVRLFGAASLFVLLFAVRIQPAHAASCVLADISYPNSAVVSVPIGHSGATQYYHNGVFVGQDTGIFNVSPVLVQPSSPGDRFVVLDTSTDCAAGGGPVTYFNPGDARLDPHPGDRLAVYCNTDNLAVYGILSDSSGKQLVDPKLSDVLNTWQSFSDGMGGTVSIGGQGSTLAVEWVNLTVGATGKGDFAKTVTCGG